MKRATIIEANGILSKGVYTFYNAADKYFSLANYFAIVAKNEGINTSDFTIYIPKSGEQKDSSGNIKPVIAISESVQIMQIELPLAKDHYRAFYDYVNEFFKRNEFPIVNNLVSLTKSKLDTFKTNEKYNATLCLSRDLDSRVSLVYNIDLLWQMRNNDTTNDYIASILCHLDYKVSTMAEDKYDLLMDSFKKSVEATLIKKVPEFSSDLTLDFGTGTGEGYQHTIN